MNPECMECGRSWSASAFFYTSWVVSDKSADALLAHGVFKCEGVNTPGVEGVDKTLITQLLNISTVCINFVWLYFKFTLPDFWKVERVTNNICPSVCKLFCANRFYQTWPDQRIATKLAHDGLEVSVHIGPLQGMLDLKVEVKGHVIPTHLEFHKKIANSVFPLIPSPSICPFVHSVFFCIPNSNLQKAVSALWVTSIAHMVK